MRNRNRILGWSLNRRAAMYVAGPAFLALFTMFIVSALSSRPAYADHNSMYTVCPDPISEGNSGQMGIRRSGYKIKSATFFTDHLYYTADSSDYEEYHGVKIESESSGGDRTLKAPIVTKEDTLPEHDETFAMGFWDGGVWHYCVVTIQDDDAPEIVNVEIVSSPADRYAYRAGEAIDIAVDLDQKVDAEGTPLMALFLGDGDESTWRGASYHSGSGSRSLVFRYTVKPEDMDTDGISVGAAAVSDDRNPAYGFSGSIYARGTDVPIDYTHSGVEGTWRQKVDGRPYVQSARVTSSPPDGWAAYRANQIIEITLTFNTDVVVEGDVSVGMFLGLDPPGQNLDDIIRQVNYNRGSGTDTLVFGYTVREGDMDPKGIGLVLGSELTGFGGDGTIRGKGTGVDRNPWYRGTGHQPDHKVDTAPPTVSSVSITSRPDNGESYSAGETVSVEVAFSENVTPSGNLAMELDIGSVARVATLRPMPERTFSTTLVFDYEVQGGDEDSDGVSIGANRLKGNGGVYDRAGNAASLSHNTVAAHSGQKVDAPAED